MDDLMLLREYATRNSEAAFETIVTRRVGFVYAAALRQVRDPHLAEEITHAVFIILAQKAGRISDKTILAGWLFKTTRFAAIAQTRELVKRQRRELEVFMQSEIQSATPDPFWEQMSPLLDEALATLGETDRQAALLRFFENKSLAEVGSHLGTGEDTARKRVSRALEKLRKFFSKRGVVSTTAIIAGAISANSVQAAPVALAKSVTAVALAKGAAASGSTLTLIKGALKIMAWTKTKTVIVLAAATLLAGTATVGTVSWMRTRDPGKSAQYSQEGWQLFGAKQWNEAFAKFNQAIKLDSQNAEAWHGRGWACLKLDKLSEAEKALHKALALTPDYPGIWNGLGLVYARQKKFDQAETHLLQAAAKSGGQAPVIWRNLARLYLA